MGSVAVVSFPNASSIATGGNLWRGKNCVKNYYATNENLWRGKNCAKNYYATSSYTPKVSQHNRKIEKEYNFLCYQQPSLKHLYKGIEGGSTYQECNRKYVVKTAPKPSFESDPRSIERKNIMESIKSFLDVFYMFCTPRSFIAPAFSVISSCLLAVEKLSDISPLFFTGVLQAVIPNLFMSVYVHGINQLGDVEIDKINKPYLPLASGKLSFTTGVIIVASCLILGLGLGWIVGSWPLIWSLILPSVICAAYSVNVPLLRWKMNPVLAAMCTVVNLAFVLPIATFLHMQTFVFKRPAFFSRPLIFATTFMSLYTLVIALFKDIPDIEGDQAFGVQTFAARFGQKRIFWICISLLEMAYGVALLMGATSSCLWSKIVTGLGHAVLALVVLYRARSVDLRSKASITSFYVLIWKLLHVEYFLIPLVR